MKRADSCACKRPGRGRWVLGAACVASVAMLGTAVIEGCSDNGSSTFVIGVLGPDGASPFGSGSVATVQLRVRPQTGPETTVSTVPLVSAGVSVPSSAETGVGALVLAGLDASNDTIVYGRTPYFADLSDLPYVGVTLTIFAQPVDAIAEIANPIDSDGSTDSTLTAPAAPLVAVWGSEDFAFISSYGDTSLRALDLLAWTQSEAPAAFGKPIATLFANDALIGEIATDGTIVSYSPEDGSLTSLVPPTGISMTNVAGGMVTMGDDGRAVIPASTRTDAAAPDATDVLVIAEDGTLSSAQLVAKRAHGTATWVVGRGLFVAGGDSTTTELLPETTGSASTSSTLFTAATTTPYSLPATGPVVMVALDTSNVLVVAADGTVSKIDLSCVATVCTPAIVSTVTADVVTPAAGDGAFFLETGDIALIRGGAVEVINAALTSFRRLSAATDPAASGGVLTTGQLLFAQVGVATLSAYQPPRQ